MTIEQEKPWGAPDWGDNAPMYERKRVEALRHAERLESEGDLKGAERWRAFAENDRIRRDECQRDYVRRQLNRQVHRPW